MEVQTEAIYCTAQVAKPEAATGHEEINAGACLVRVNMSQNL